MISTRHFIYKSSSSFHSVWWLYRVHQLQQLYIPLLFLLSSKVLVLMSLFAFIFQFFPVGFQDGKVHYSASSLLFFVEYHED